MDFAFGLILGLLLGVALAFVLLYMRRKAAQAELTALQEQMRESFSSLAATALDANTERLHQRTAGLLDGKKELIDQALVQMNERLNKLGEYFRQVEGERKSEFSRLGESVRTLAATTGELHQMLASTQRRGAWGERMADDILRLAGMVEGVNYAKQSSADAETGRPDFTFYLTGDMKVNMDVKFPLEHYKAWLDAETDEQRAAQRDQLARDVRNHIKTVAGRGYIDTKNGTADYVMLFIPSEQIYSLVLDAQPDLIDDALGQHVMLTSPMTLYAALSVIRQSAEQANLMKTADVVLDLLADFAKQWQKYKEEVDRLGNQLQTVQRTYDGLVSTRTNTLEKPLQKIEDLRAQTREDPRDG